MILWLQAIVTRVSAGGATRLVRRRLIRSMILTLGIPEGFCDKVDFVCRLIVFSKSFGWLVDWPVIVVQCYCFCSSR